MSLLVVGSVAYDSVETAHGKVDRALGGSATFFSMASSLFARTHLVAVVGDDFADDDVARMERRGVDLAGLERVAGKTFRWGGRYSTHFETRESLFTELNVFSDFRPKLHPHHTSADLLFLANIEQRRIVAPRHGAECIRQEDDLLVVERQAVFGNENGVPDQVVNEGGAQGARKTQIVDLKGGRGVREEGRAGLPGEALEIDGDVDAEVA